MFKYFAAIISWMFLAALSVQSAAEDFIFRMLDRFVVSAAEGSSTSSGKPKKGKYQSLGRVAETQPGTGGGITTFSGQSQLEE